MKNFFFCAFLVLSSAAYAAEPPVEISAAGTLEWDRAARTYTARKDVVATRGPAEVRSENLTAFYDEASGGTDIVKLKAAGDVVISSPPYKAYGAEGVYDVKTGNAVLTGGDLKIETETERLTARDRIEYSARENRMTATGDATAVKGTQTLKADRLAAFFRQGPDGKMLTEKITAEGGITLTTAKETVYGDQGVYDVQAQKAVLTGNVRIHQGESRLEGTRATVDMRTGVSQLSASENRATEGRVKGVFYPRAKNGAGQ